MREQIVKLRDQMKEHGIDVYVIPTADFHQSEYVGEHFKARAYVTGFTGSAGTAVREFPNVQAGFRKGRRTRDQMANILWITEKAREFQKNIYFLLY